jgi:hypothetical protein
MRRVVRRYAELIRNEYSCRHSSQRKKLLSIYEKEIPALLFTRSPPLIQAVHVDPFHCSSTKSILVDIRCTGICMER